MTAAAISSGWSPQYERLEEDFEISDGVVLPAAASTVHPISGGGGNAGAPHGVGRTGGDMGRFFLRQPAGLLPAAQHSAAARHCALGRSGAQLLDLAEGSFTADVYRARREHAVQPVVIARQRLQYDTVSRDAGLADSIPLDPASRQRPVFVYTHNWHEVLDGRRAADSPRSTTASRRKLVYTLRF